MMEAVNNWLDRVTQSSLDVPHPAENDAQKAPLDGKGLGGSATNASNIVPFRILIKSLELLPSSVSSVGFSVYISYLNGFILVTCYSI
jgi:hypothetical protein